MVNIKNILIPATMMLISVNVFGQLKTKVIEAGGYKLEASTVDPKLNKLFCIVGQVPKFPGGKDSLISYAKHFLHYPESAIRDSVQGKITLEFTIDKNGKAVNEKIIKGARVDLDTLCLLMIKQMPTWIPGNIREETVAVNFSWSIIFQIE